MRLLAVRCAAGLVLAGALAAPAGAADRYVSPAGSGSSCTQPQPCRQIRDALALYPAGLGPGDTIFVADGSYLGFDVEDVHGASGQPITIKAQGPNAVVTVTTDRPDNRDTILVTFSSFVVVDGLTAFGANRAAVRVDQSPDVTVRNGVFGDNTTWGIFTDFSDDLLLEDNECYGSMQEHGIYVSNSGDRPVVRGNRLHDNNAAGVQLNADLSSGGDGIISQALIEKNVIYGNGAAGGAAINLDGVQDSIVRNNLLYDNHATGIVNYMGDGAEGPKGMQIYHNTVDQAPDGRWALLIWNTAGPIVVRNNVLYNRNPSRGGITYLDPSDVANTDSDYNVMDLVTPDDSNTVYTLAEWQALGHEPHSLVSGPLSALFVDANNRDYHLPLGSPALDNGETLASVPEDIEGTPRPQGPASDIGAYERPGAVLPSISIGDVTQLEGNAGTSAFGCPVNLSNATGGTVAVDYATFPGSATSPADFQAASGTLTFAGATTLTTIVVNVVGDTVPEPDEDFQVLLSNPAGATLADAQATGLIVNDDVAAGTSLELTHGASLTADLAAQPGPSADVDLYRISQKPRSSYEVVVDSRSGDLGNPASPILLERVAADLVTQLQAAQPVGAGSSRSLRWQNPLGMPQDTQLVRVTSGGCTTGCDAGDTYRIRAWETTLRLARLNNSGTQVTVLLVENAGDTAVSGTAWYWSGAGTLVGSQPLSIPPRGTAVLNTSLAAPSTSGSITVSHDGRHGQLAGKAVAVEPATGFSFDTLAQERPD